MFLLVNMPRPISRRELIRKLCKLGFVGPFSGGRHQFMARKNFRIVVPNPHNKDIGSSLLLRIIHDLGIITEEFEDL